MAAVKKPNLRETLHEAAFFLIGTIKNSLTDSTFTHNYTEFVKPHFVSSFGEMLATEYQSWSLIAFHLPLRRHSESADERPNPPAPL